MEVEEVWKSITGYEDIYEISNKGHIRNKKTLHVKSQQQNANKFPTVHLKKDGKDEKVRVAGLVARHFLDNPYNLPIVVHKDADPSNNDMQNLYWGTREQCMEAAWKRKGNFGKPLDQYRVDGTFMKTWANFREIIDAKPGWTRAGLSMCCCGKNKTYRGFIWKWSPVEVSVDLTERPGEEFRVVGNLKDNQYSGYEVSNYGRVRNSAGIFFSLQHGGAYPCVTLRNDENRQPLSIAVHILVALLFVNGRTPERKFVNHIDEDKKNPYYKNLEWVTSKENADHSCAIAVEALDKVTDKVMWTFGSIKDAYTAMGAKRGDMLNDVLKGKFKTAYGYKWRKANIAS